MAKRKIKGLVSTIILAVCLLISLFFADLLFSINLNEGWQDYEQSLGEAGEFENAGEMGIVLVLVAAMGALAIVFVSYLIAALTLVSSAVPLIFSIKNIKAENKAIKIINIVYTPVFSSIIIFSLIKMVLFALGMG